MKSASGTLLGRAVRKFGSDRAYTEHGSDTVDQVLVTLTGHGAVGFAEAEVTE